jgi:predicted nucleotidyltransferase
LPESLRAALLSRLREREIPELAALPDVGEGLEHKLYAAIRDALSVEEPRSWQNPSATPCPGCAGSCCARPWA